MASLSSGEKMIDSTLLDMDGEEHKLSSFNDKYILLSFWSMTCLICMKAAKDLKKIHESYKPKLNIVGINMDTEKSMWEQGTKRDAITWINLSDGKGVSDGVGLDYGIAGFPAYVLIDSNGIIIDRWMGYKPGRFEEKMNIHLK